MKKKWVQENQGLLIKSGLVIGGGAFLVYLLRQFGIIQSSAEKKKDAEKEKLAHQNSTALTSAFNANYYKGKIGSALIKKETALHYADQIYDAVGHFYDDESAIYAVFRQLKSKTQVSWLSEIFYKEYGEDLYNFLADSLNDSEMNTINQIVNSMPDK